MLSRSVTLALVIGQKGLGFNPKIRLRRPCRGLCYTVRRPLLLRRKDGSQCSGLCYTVRRPLLLRRKGRLSVLMIRFRWVRSKPFAPSSQSMAQPSLCGHQQQQACNTIRGGTGSRTTGLRPVTPRLVVGNGLRPFCVDSEFGLVFYSYLSIGTLNLNLNSVWDQRLRPNWIQSL